MRLHYLQFSRATQPVDDDTADLPFRLVEALVNMRAAGDHRGPEAVLATRVADACLRVLGVPADTITTTRAHTARLLPAT